MNDIPDDPRDPKLSSFYRKANQAEPPPALDAAIIAAARSAAAPQRPPRPWWRRLQAPFALAASILLAVILTLTIDHKPPAEFDAPASAPVKERPAAERKAPADERESLAPPPPAGSGGRESGAAKGLPAPTADVANKSLADGERRNSLAAPAATSALQASREDAAPVAPKPPETWLEEIHSLRRQSRPEEAERSLREFRAAYPDYRLPEDLR